MLRSVTILSLAVLVFARTAFGQALVVPTDRVVNGVSIRASATTNSVRIGTLLPSEVATFLGEVPS